MKNLISIPGLVLTLGLATSNLSYGQFTSNSNITRNSLSESMKNDLGKEIANRAAFENLKKLNVKLHKNFTRYFANATDIKTTTDKNYIMVNCQINGVKTLVYYYSNGRWASTLRMMEPHQLPAQLSDQILDNYPEYKISRGKEVIVGPNSAYLIDIENERRFKTVRIIDGETDIYQEFEKQQNK